MSDELVFYTSPMSRGRIARWMLEEVGAPYRTELLEFGAGTKAPAFLAINPMGKLPALTHGGVAITETAAICAYLADAFPDAGLAPPPGDRARGAYYRWLFFAAGPVEAVIMNRAMGLEVPAGREVMAGFGTPALLMDVLEKAVTGSEFIAGDKFSAADVYLGSQLGWGMQFGSIEKRPAFEAYLARVSGRPAAVRAREIDDALIAAKASAAQATAA
jgi:glutathione S-transferase